MSDGKFPPDNLDDLPRTLRRAREQQLRDQQVQAPVQQPQLQQAVSSSANAPLAPVSRTRRRPSCS